MKKFNKEEELLNFIREHQEEYGYPPTVREMCRAVKVSSTSTISYYLTKLENSGQIKKSPNKNRALEIVGDDFSTSTNVCVETEVFDTSLSNNEILSAIIITLLSSFIETFPCTFIKASSVILLLNFS